jgi:hypothetical protein
MLQLTVGPRGYPEVLPPTYKCTCRAMFVLLDITITSVMACRIFRVLKLGFMVGPMTERAMSNLVFRDIGSISYQPSENAVEVDNQAEDSGSSTTRNCQVDGADLTDFGGDAFETRVRGPVSV